ncbi:hypothetical protein [uncultured Brevundimonas sp.]|uniref:hypothetical protein n=1 Tax=uncultured Brevundimonas sp. TaxID=213418 RepID=UPI0030EB8FC3
MNLACPHKPGPLLDKSKGHWPRGQVIFHSFPGEPVRECFVYVPRGADASSPVVTLIHGITRNAAEHVFRFRAKSDRTGAILIAPLFVREAFGQYQQVMDKPTRPRADEALFDMLDAVATDTGVSVERFYMFGFSGGAQFAHRFMMMHPERITSIAIAAAGWYTFPTTDLPYPLGIGSCPIPEHSFDPDRFLAVPRHVLVGARDVGRDEAFRTSRKLDQLQGDNRLARARNWFAAMERETHQRGIRAAPSSLTVLDGISHSFTDAAEHGALAETVFEKFNLSSIKLTETNQ